MQLSQDQENVKNFSLNLFALEAKMHGYSPVLVDNCLKQHSSPMLMTLYDSVYGSLTDKAVHTFPANMKTKMRKFSSKTYYRNLMRLFSFGANVFNFYWDIAH